MSTAMMNPVSRDNLLSIFAAPTLWGLYFGFVYTVNGIACAKQLTGWSVGGFPVVDIIMAAATAATLLLLLALAVASWLQFRPLRDTHIFIHETDPSLAIQARRRFMALAGLLHCLLAIAATIYVGLPILLLPNC
jgi:hypothetical protein